MFPRWSGPSVVPVAAVGPAPAAPPVVAAAVAVAAPGSGAVAGAAAGSATRPVWGKKGSGLNFECY